MAARQHQVPEWEIPTQPPPKRGLASKFSFLTSLRPANGPVAHKEERVAAESFQEDSTATPPQRRRLPAPLAFFNTRRKLLYIILAALALLILIIGLSVGLTRGRSSKTRNLPLPSSREIFTGDLTFYSPGPGYGACGYENTPDEAICALSHLLWDAVSTSSNPNHNILCGKKLRITRFHPSEGRNNSVDVTVVDRCTGCKETDVDLSISQFEILGDEDQGRVVGSWAWL